MFLWRGGLLRFGVGVGLPYLNGCVVFYRNVAVNFGFICVGVGGDLYALSSTPIDAAKTAALHALIGR